MRALGLALPLLLAGAPPAAADDLARHWRDGKAELSGYELTQPRYGQLRKGSVVLVFVTEPFSESARVKADPGRHPKSDVFEVLKLNAVKDFQTGIYDYNVMTGTFATWASRQGLRAGMPAKVTFSMQEWCGSVFEELKFERDRIDQLRNSYFDGEGAQQAKLPQPAGGVTLDELPFVVRQFPRPLLAPGAKKKLPLLPTLERTRLLHRPLEWVDGTLERAAKREKITVPAGTFEVEAWTARAKGDVYVYRVEAAFPHRIIEWTGPDGEHARLAGSARLAYWQLHENGREKLLESIGIKVP